MRVRRQLVAAPQEVWDRLQLVPLQKRVQGLRLTVLLLLAVARQIQVLMLTVTMRLPSVRQVMHLQRRQFLSVRIPSLHKNGPVLSAHALKQKRLVQQPSVVGRRQTVSFPSLLAVATVSVEIMLLERSLPETVVPPLVVLPGLPVRMRLLWVRVHRQR
ncbi:hypothetical protein HMPREF2753_09425 [Neisseria sp. HMSC071C03]|nr:hypothetical protein HMPREF3054_02285 [Neisseria sp. HMSC071B12]OHR51212.1 hypothetical protein HMPREF2753_09425 [Neisseria sp. HMSC071C03]